MAVSAAINGGTLYKPYIVKRITEHETGQIIKEVKETIIRENIITEETSEIVRMTLESVVSLGTGRNAYIEGHSVGGKTGTAQKVKNGMYMVGNYIVSFIGFTPVDNPEVVVYVAIDYPKGITQYGGTVAAPVAKEILTDAINILGIEEDENVKDKVYNWNDTKYYDVPNVVGLEKKDAIYYFVLILIISIVALIINNIFGSNLMFISQNFPNTFINVIYVVCGKLFTLVMILGQATLPFWIVYEITNLIKKENENAINY